MLELLFQWSSRDLCDLTGAAWDHVLVREKSGQANYRQMQGGILYWLHGSLQDARDISPEIALIKT